MFDDETAVALSPVGVEGAVVSEETVALAEQLAVVPPFVPVQNQVHGPVPVTVVAVPAEQRFMAGAVATVVPFALPHAPFTTALATENVTVALPEVFPAVSWHFT